VHARRAAVPASSGRCAPGRSGPARCAHLEQLLRVLRHAALARDRHPQRGALGRLGVHGRCARAQGRPQHRQRRGAGRRRRRGVPAGRSGKIPGGGCARASATCRLERPALTRSCRRATQARGRLHETGRAQAASGRFGLACSGRAGVPLWRGCRVCSIVSVGARRTSSCPGHNYKRPWCVRGQDTVCNLTPCLAFRGDLCKHNSPGCSARNSGRAGHQRGLAGCAGGAGTAEAQQLSGTPGCRQGCTRPFVSWRPAAARCGPKVGCTAVTPPFIVSEVPAVVLLAVDALVHARPGLSTGRSVPPSRTRIQAPCACPCTRGSGYDAGCTALCAAVRSRGEPVPATDAMVVQRNRQGRLGTLIACASKGKRM